jgi:RNA polymerase sigma-70 factor (ECF subfamily)
MRVRKTPMKPPGTTAAPADEAARQRFMSLVRERLSELYDYVRHELAAREAVGNLVPDDLTPDDVVDDVILRAYREFVRNPEEQPGDDWLRRLAKERIRSEVRRRRWEREHGMHIEDDIPETSPSEDAAMLGEQILYFHQPDEDLRVEDVIQDPSAPVPGDDDDDDERRALRRCVDVALAELPRLWRRTLVLRHMKGLTIGEIARVLHLPEAEVRRTAAQARAFLRQRLLESGCRVAPHNDQ